MDLWRVSAGILLQVIGCAGYHHDLIDAQGIQRVAVRVVLPCDTRRTDDHWLNSQNGTVF